MFANVIRARVLKDETGKDLSVEGSGEPPKEVAIKIIRCQESMYVDTILFYSLTDNVIFI